MKNREIGLDRDEQGYKIEIKPNKVSNFFSIDKIENMVLNIHKQGGN